MSVWAGKGLAKLEFLTVNQRGEEVLDGQATVYQADSQAGTTGRPQPILS